MKIRPPLNLPFMSPSPSDKTITGRDGGDDR